MSEITVVIPEPEHVETAPEIIEIEAAPAPESNTGTLIDFAFEIGELKLSIERIRSENNFMIDKYADEFNGRISELSKLISDLTMENFEANIEEEPIEETQVEEIVIGSVSPEVAEEVKSRKRFFL